MSRLSIKRGEPDEIIVGLFAIFILVFVGFFFWHPLTTLLVLVGLGISSVLFFLCVSLLA